MAIFTGSTFLSPLGLAGKRVELLKEAFDDGAQASRVVKQPSSGRTMEWRATSEAARALGIETVYVPFAGEKRTGQRTGSGRRSAHGRRLSSSRTFSRWCTKRKIADFAITHGLPSMFRLGRILRRRRTCELRRRPASGILFLAGDVC